MGRLSPQLGLFDRPAPFVPASPTSKAAAVGIAPTSGTLRACVLSFIRGRGVSGATCEEVEHGLGLKHQTASARVRELAQEDLITNSQTCRKTTSGRAAVVWVAKELYP